MVLGLTDTNSLRDKNQRTGRAIPSNLSLHTAETMRISPPHASGDTAQENRNSNPDLRREVEYLRQELERIREGQEAIQDAPPLYESEIEHVLEN